MRYAVLLALVVSAGCSGSKSPVAPSPITPPVAVVPPVVTPPVVTPPPVNPLLSDPQFSLPFYQQFALGSYDGRGTIYRLSRWARAPKVYLQTVDDRLATVDPRLVEQTAVAIITTTGQWTGGAFGVESLERGTSTREGQPGWLTVKWSSNGVCGNTVGIGLEGGTITMNHRRPECTCGPLVAKHELGHAMGFSHTDSNGDLMAVTFQGICDKPLSQRELFHARVAYSMPIGSESP